MSSNAGTDDLEQMRTQLYNQFEELLGGQGNIDAADRDSLLRHFRDALDDQSAASEPVDVDTMQADVAQTLGLMQQHGLIDSQDSMDMGQAFARALQPLHNETLKRATEFARRVHEEGEEAANQWFAAQAREAGAAASAGPAAIPAHVASALDASMPQRRRR
jgi:hypothetical protein